MKENNQEYYNSIMTEEVSKRIIELRDKSKVSWKDLAKMIKEEFGEDFALEDNVITSMYLEYAARDFLDK